MYVPGDILLVRFPFTNLTRIKKRPAVVVSSSAFNSATADVVVCGLTTNCSGGSHRVSVENRDLASGAIPQPSEVVVSKIATLEKTIVEKLLGKLNDAKVAEIREELKQLFDIT